MNFHLYTWKHEELLFKKVAVTEVTGPFLSSRMLVFWLSTCRHRWKCSAFSLSICLSGFEDTFTFTPLTSGSRHI